MERTLAKENFWNQVHKDYPTVTDKFCKWIDLYKKSAGWNSLFFSELSSETLQIKFHDLPVEMQLGIIQRFFWEEYAVRVDFKAYDSIEQIISEMRIVFGFYQDTENWGKHMKYAKPVWFTPEEYFKTAFMESDPNNLNSYRIFWPEAKESKTTKWETFQGYKSGFNIPTNNERSPEENIAINDHQIGKFLGLMSFEYKPHLGRTVTDHPYGRYEKGKIHKDPNTITVSILKRQVGRKIQQAVTSIPGKMVVILQKEKEAFPRICKFFTIEQEGGKMLNEHNFNTVHELEKIISDLIIKHQTKLPRND